MHAAAPASAVWHQSPSLQSEVGQRRHQARILPAWHARGPTLRPRVSGSAAPTGWPARCQRRPEPQPAGARFPESRSRRPASPHGNGKLGMDFLPLVEAIGVDAEQGGAAVEGSSLCHELGHTVAVLWAV